MSRHCDILVFPKANDGGALVSDVTVPTVAHALAVTRFDALTQLSTTTSTNDVALALVTEQGSAHVVVTAEQQTAGRGRLGRRWVHRDTPGGTPSSLAVTATLAAPKHATMVPFAAGLAVYDTLAAFGVQPGLKWPNDLLLGGKKVVGILVERVPVASHDLIVVGTGFNLDWRGIAREPDELWTSLGEQTQQPVDAAVLLARYLIALDGWLDALDSDIGQTELLATYRTRCVTLGQPVTVTLASGRTVTGIAQAISERGELELLDNGTLVTVTSGDVWHDLDGPNLPG